MPISIQDLNVSLSLREVDYLISFEFCGMQNAPTQNAGKTLGVPQVKFRKIHLFEISHSAKYTFPTSRNACQNMWCYLSLSHLKVLKDVFMNTVITCDSALISTSSEPVSGSFNTQQAFGLHKTAPDDDDNSCDNGPAAYKTFVDTAFNYTALSVKFMIGLD